MRNTISVLEKDGEALRSKVDDVKKQNKSKLVDMQLSRRRRRGVVRSWES